MKDNCKAGLIFFIRDCCVYQIEAHLDTLINEQASYVLTRAGLGYIYSCVQQYSSEQVSTRNQHTTDEMINTHYLFIITHLAV